MIDHGLIACTEAFRALTCGINHHIFMRAPSLQTKTLISRSTSFGVCSGVVRGLLRREDLGYVVNLAGRVQAASTIEAASQVFSSAIQQEYGEQNIICCFSCRVLPHLAQVIGPLTSRLLALGEQSNVCIAPSAPGMLCDNDSSNAMCRVFCMSRLLIWCVTLLRAPTVPARS